MSKIEWTGKTWNPIVGCSIVSPGCTNCYAMRMAARLQKINRTGGSGTSYVNHYDGTTKCVNGKPVWTGKLALAPDHILLEPLRRKKPTTWFVNSMGDLFHEDVPDEWIDRVFAIMALCPPHTLQVLTKRSERMREYVSDPKSAHRIYMAVCDMVTEENLSPDAVLIAPGVDELFAPTGTRIVLGQWPLPNVWLGVSTEDQKRADERIPDLLATPAAVRFISAEPLLGPLRLPFLVGSRVGYWAGRGTPNKEPWFEIDGQNWSIYDVGGIARGVDWVIVGGESGNGARPMHPDWARGLRDQCAASGVPFFFKQWGSWYPAIDRDKDDPDWRGNYRTDYQKRRILNLAGGCGFHGERVHVMRHYSKKATGRLLDGVEHNAMPEAAE